MTDMLILLYIHTMYIYILYIHIIYIYIYIYISSVTNTVVCIEKEAPPWYS